MNKYKFHPSGMVQDPDGDWIPRKNLEEISSINNTIKNLVNLVMASVNESESKRREITEDIEQTRRRQNNIEGELLIIRQRADDLATVLKEAQIAIADFCDRVCCARDDCKSANMGGYYHTPCPLFPYKSK